MTTPREPDGVALLAVSRAPEEWRALGRALRDHGPTPCERSDAERWWPAGRTDVTAVVAACLACPVIAECRTYAQAARESAGIWGGLAFERRTE